MNVLLDSREVSLDARQVLLDAMPKNARAVEIGVYEGDFSARILNRSGPGRTAPAASVSRPRS